MAALQSLAGGNDEEAADMLSRSLAQARGQGALAWELRTSISLARLLAETGRPVPAFQRLTAVRSRFTEGFRTTDLLVADLLLADLSAESRNGSR